MGALIFIAIVIKTGFLLQTNFLTGPLTNLSPCFPLTGTNLFANLTPPFRPNRSPTNLRFVRGQICKTFAPLVHVMGTTDLHLANKSDPFPRTGNQIFLQIFDLHLANKSDPKGDRFVTDL